MEGGAIALPDAILVPGMQRQRPPGSESVRPSSEFDERDARSGRLTESQRHAWSALNVLWEERKREGGLSEEECARIDSSFYSSDQNSEHEYGWERLNDTELRVGALLSARQINVQYFVLLSAAVRRNLPDIAEYRDRMKLFSQHNTHQEQRAAYLALLNALQCDFIEKRLLRQLRESVADRMFRYGVFATLAPLFTQALFVAFVWMTSIIYHVERFYVGEWESITSFGLVATLGMLGAYFSRMISFQGTITSLTFEGVTNEYLSKVIRLRMLYGMLGALIFFVILRSEIITSELLPKFDNKADYVDLGKSNILLLLIPSSNLAKVIIWAFLAGFSERLVPDALARIEQRPLVLEP